MNNAARAEICQSSRSVELRLLKRVIALHVLAVTDQSTDPDGVRAHVLDAAEDAGLSEWEADAWMNEWGDSAPRAVLSQIAGEGNPKGRVETLWKGRLTIRTGLVVAGVAMFGAGTAPIVNLIEGLPKRLKLK